VFDLGSGPHNTVRWSPHGRFVAIAGFGNLPGDLVFYEKKADGKCKKVGATRCAVSARSRTRLMRLNCQDFYLHRLSSGVGGQGQGRGVRLGESGGQSSVRVRVRVL